MSSQGNGDATVSLLCTLKIFDLMSISWWAALVLDQSSYQFQPHCKIYKLGLNTASLQSPLQQLLLLYKSSSITVKSNLIHINLNLQGKLKMLSTSVPYKQ